MINLYQNEIKYIYFQASNHFQSYNPTSNLLTPQNSTHLYRKPVKCEIPPENDYVWKRQQCLRLMASNNN